MRYKNLRFMASVITCASLSFFNFLEGAAYGARSLGMGATAVANPQDSIVVATNPAGIAFLCDRIDIGLQDFRPHRTYSYTGSNTPPFVFPGDHVISQRDNFFIPDFGIVKSWDDCNTFALALYGRGGLNTTYPRDNPVFSFGSSKGQLQKVGLDYIQIVMSPTYAMTFCDNQAIGVSLVLGAQRFRLQGLQGFRPFSSSPNHVTNNGYDWALGAGVSIGWMGEICNGIKLGVAYSSRVFMSKFHKYRGFLAEHGSLDIPAEVCAGFSWQATDDLLFAFDFDYVFYKNVKTISNSISHLNTDLLGTSSGAGFGWKNVAYYKVGVNYRICPVWEVRAGYAYGTLPFSSSQVDINILSTAVNNQYASLGLTYLINECSQLDFAWVHAFEHEIKGQSVIGLGRIKISSYQDFFTIGYTAHLY
jgi:long-chain fatty acid transport protein